MNWMNEIGLHTYDIRHIEGKKNVCADQLSRQIGTPLGEAYKVPEVIASMDSIQLESLSPEAIREAQKICPDVENHWKGNVPAGVQVEETEVSPGVSLLCEVSGPKPRPLLPAKYRQNIIQTFHHLDHANHKEVARRTSENYYWPKLASQVKEFCKSCHGCQSVKTHKYLNPGQGNFPVAEKRFSDLTVDVIGPLVESDGFKYIFTCIDRVSHWVEAISMREASTEACATAFINGWVQRFGVPFSINSDNGVTFCAELWKKMQEMLDVKVKFSPLYHPQTQGIIERQHRTIKESLKAALIEMGDTHGKFWNHQLPWTMLGRRMSLQEDLGASACQLTLGSSPSIPGVMLGDPGPPLDVPELQGMLTTLGANADQPPKTTSNHSKTTPIYMANTEKATHVYVQNEKITGMMSKWSGPYKILERLSNSTIKIHVGYYAGGQIRTEVQHWSRCKPAYCREGVPDAQRPKLGQPRKQSPEPSEPAKRSIDTDKSKQASAEGLALSSNNNNKPARENSNEEARPARSTRNPNPKYVDAIWSASQSEIAAINRSISNVNK